MEMAERQRGLWRSWRLGSRLRISSVWVSKPPGYRQKQRSKSADPKMELIAKSRGTRTNSSKRRISGLFSPLRDYAHLPWSLFSIVSFAIRQRHHNLKDLKVLAFILLSPWFIALGFKGKIPSPFGNVVVGSREKMKSIAY